MQRVNLQVLKAKHPTDFEVEYKLVVEATDPRAMLIARRKGIVGLT